MDVASAKPKRETARETYIPFNGHQMAIAVITKRLPVYAEKAL